MPEEIGKCCVCGISGSIKWFKVPNGMICRGCRIQINDLEIAKKAGLLDKK